MNLTDNRIPVILDTDIGDDIDDTWALAMMLKSPELDVKLVVGDTGDTLYRAKLIAKMLQTAARTDVPVGMGIPNKYKGGAQRQEIMHQGEWVKDYDLDSYPGAVHEDGVGALIDTILESPAPVSLICIGPVPNIAAALEREPRIARRARYVGMQGCLRTSQKKNGEVYPEHNVKCFVSACQKVFTAGWNMVITPVDTCGFVRLEGARYRAVRDCDDPLITALIENYRVWSQSGGCADEFPVRSSVLFDTVAIYLAFSEDLLVMEDLGVRVTEDGCTVIDDKARRIRCATRWKDLEAYKDFLTQRLTGTEQA